MSPRFLIAQWARNDGVGVSGAILAVLLLTTPALANVGSIQGVVTFTGEKPTATLLKRSSDPVCAKKQMEDPSILLGSNGKFLANAVVRVVKGAPDGQAPTTPVRVNQEDCMYSPRVQGAVVGQKVLVTNADPTLHNVRAQDGSKSLFNVAQPPKAPPVEREVKATGDLIKLKCDVHPWMTGYVLYNRNPHFAVSDASGSFTIRDLPAGHYTLEAWHEVLGTQVAEVTVAPGKVSSAKFNFKSSKAR